jgi:hypothetical protein
MLSPKIDLNPIQYEWRKRFDDFESLENEPKKESSEFMKLRRQKTSFNSPTHKAHSSTQLPIINDKRKSSFAPKAKPSRNFSDQNVIEKLKKPEIRITEGLIGDKL